MVTDEKYPQATKLAAASDERAAVADFLEWCSQRGWHLAEHVAERLYPVTVPMTHDAVIYEYLGIDVVVLEAERRAMLEAMRDA